MKRYLILLAAALFALASCDKPTPDQPDQPGQDTIPSEPAFTGKYVGGDISLLPSYEAANTPYIGRDGQKIADLVQYLHDTCQWTSCRVRLFVNPVITNADGTKQGEVQDLAYVTALGKRIKDAGMQFMLDFHYSDTWADPVKQTIPTAWQSIPDAELPDTVYAYTKRCLEELTAAGAAPDLIQVGNEVSYGMLWRGSAKSTSDAVHAYDDAKYNEELTRWERFGKLLNAGSRACREICPKAQVVIHIERTANANMCVNYYTYLERQNVDYDVIGLSYYPFWHGTLETQLHQALTKLHTRFPDRKILIVETAYYNNYWPSDGISYDTRSTWPATPAGQAAFITALCERLKQYDYVNGLYYWFPEENGCGGNTWSASNIVITSWLNRGLFNPDNNKHQVYDGLYRISDFL